MMNTLIMTRYQFFRCLVLVASSSFLCACGGGGVYGPSTLNGDANGVKEAAPVMTSDNGTVVPPASSIVDLVGNVWTIRNGQIYENGEKDPNSYNVSMLMFYGNSIYRKDSMGNFSQWTGSTWEKADDPQSVPISADTASSSG